MNNITYTHRTILLSIKPEFVKQIFAGTKRYEFRRRLPKEEVGKLVIYATNPVKQVMGEIKLEGLLSGTPDYIWEITKEEAGITQSRFRQYFKDTTVAYAYVLREITVYDNPKSLQDLGILNAPQSFVYI
jgi:predicted transcriptional regulator